jgi:two-component system, NarL family, invasion response regulator UvrY
MNNKISILMVDDYELNIAVWSRLLNRDNRFEVVAKALTGADAVMLAKKYQPQIVLMDIDMFPVDGFTTTKLIVKAVPAAKVIGFSSSTSTKYVKKIIAAGANGYVVKMTSKADLYEAIIEVDKGNFFVCKEIKQKVVDDFFSHKSPSFSMD